MKTQEKCLGSQAEELDAPKVERARYLLGVSEGCKRGFLKGLMQAKEEIGKRLLQETELSARAIADLIGYDVKQMEGLAK